MRNAYNTQYFIKKEESEFQFDFFFTRHHHHRHRHIIIHFHLFAQQSISTNNKNSARTKDQKVSAMRNNFNSGYFYCEWLNEKKREGMIAQFNSLCKRILTFRLESMCEHALNAVQGELFLQIFASDIF